MWGTSTVAIFFFLLPLGMAQSNPVNAPLQIQTTNLPSPQARKPYQFQLKATGGVPPYHWTVLSQPLPPDLKLDAKTGVISGTPQSQKAFSALVEVQDSSDPPLIYRKLLPTSQNSPLSVQWTARPRVTGADITGAVRVSNGSKDDFDLTVIVVAVNGFGKAFALRYEHLNLLRQTDSPDLAFESSLPLGNYTVHVDAVAEVPAKNAIYRDRLEQSGIAIQSQ